MKSLQIILLVALPTLFTTWGHSQDGGSHSLRVGVASIDVSPATLPALRNGGFLQGRSNRLDDPLHARCVVLSQDGETIAIVIVDSCMFPISLCDEIKRLVTQSTEIPSNRILISATHTHSAPSTMTCLGCGADDAYVKFVPPRVARAVTEAFQNRQPAKLGWTVVDGTEFTNCRRWITRSDRMGTDPFGKRTVRAMMHPGYQNPIYVSPAGPIDPALSILSIVSAKDEIPICVMANLSMHYFGAGQGFSADYFGEVARFLESRIDKTSGKTTSRFVGIMSQGTSGDLHWMDYSRPRKNISRSDYAARVADRVLEAWKTIDHQGSITLSMAEKRLKIGRRTPSRGRLEWARPINKKRGDVPPRNQIEVYAEQAEWIHDNPEVEIVLQAVRIGDLGITAMPNEVYGITGLKLKRQSPLTTFNLELANGAAGYIPPPEQHQLGGYTTWPARTAGLDVQAEPLIVETLVELLESVSGKKRRAMTDPLTDYSRAAMKKKPSVYWRLDDMDSKQASDCIGNTDAKYKGGVALYLPGPPGPGFKSSGYGNRSVYCAGGYLQGEIGDLKPEFSVAFWFWNGLPIDARDVTGTLLSFDSGTLEIAGKGASSGRLVFRSGETSITSKAVIATKRWHHVTLTKVGNRVLVYLDGIEAPQIDAESKPLGHSKQILLGSNGNSATSFDGKLDEVLVFERALAASEIAELYAASGMTPPPQPKPSVILGPKPTDEESRRNYASAVLSSKPVAFWRLHDQETPTAMEARGRLPATYEHLSSPFQAEKIRPNFTGGRVRAKVPKLGNTYSVEMWFRNELPIDSRPVTGYLFSRGIVGAEGAPGDSLGLGGTHSHGGRLFLFNGNQKDQLVAGSTQIISGSWSHVVMVRQNQRVMLYLNGDPKPEIDEDLPVSFPTGCEDFLIGGRNDNFANLQGMLEEIALYDRALLPKEVQAHFAAAGVKPVKVPSESTPEPLEQPKPTEPVDAIESINVPDGFEVELVAAEPLVKDPVAIDWGPDGRLWVIEMADYPLGVDGKGESGGRVRFLEDVNGDGQYDNSTLFADGLSFPTGILVWGKGILVTAAPEIVYLEDSTKDGKADIRKVLYSGFLEGNQQLRVNGLRWGLDNWVHCASGSHHAGYGKTNRIVSNLTGKEHQIGSRDFRIRPNSGAIDPQSGPSQYGRNRDDWGNWFGVQNSHPLWHYVLADHNIRRNPNFAPPNPIRQIVTPSNPKVYPASALQKRFHSFDQSGRFTSACSAMVYRDEWLFDRGPEQHAFTCEPFHNLVQHNIIIDDGVSFRFRRDNAEKNMDFFASKDRWCRPVMVRTGPDGALWIVDMYRYMIEHPQWLPQKGKDELKPWYRAGEDRGRIYRVVRSDRPARNVPRLADLSSRDLVMRMENPNGWQRDAIQRILVSRKAKDVTVQLTALAKNSKQPLARLHAICTLDGLGVLTPRNLEDALLDRHPGVRRNAVRIASRVSVNSEKLLILVDDPDAKVRLELASTLGAYDDTAASTALATLAIESRDEPYVFSAVLSSLNRLNVSSVFTMAADKIMKTSNKRHLSVLLDLVEQAIAMGDEETIGRVVNLVCSLGDNASVNMKFRLLAHTLDSLAKRGWPLDQLNTSHRDQLFATIQNARVMALDEMQVDERRVLAIQLLSRESNRADGDLVLLKSLLVPRTSVAVQLAIVKRLATQNEQEVAEVLLSGWRAQSPAVRAEVLNVLASRAPWAEVIRQKLDDGTILVSELDAALRQRLLVLGKNAPKWRNALAFKASADRLVVLEKYQPALEMVGDEKRGKVLFSKLCMSCHKINNEGHEVGPNLASITNNSSESLLVSILDPSASVEAKYLSYQVSTDNGLSRNGMLTTETGSSITLLSAEGKRETILRNEIDQLQGSTKSLMPDGLERDLEPQDLADLIQFVRNGIR